MDAVDKELLRGEVDRLTAALAEERYRHVAGLTPAPALTPIFQAHARAAHRDTVKALEAEGTGEALLAGRVAALRAERAQAAAEEAWRAAEAAASGLGPDGPVALDAAALAVPGERDRVRRLALGRAVAEASAHPAREEAAEQRARARAEVGLWPDWERVVEGDELLAASDDAYRDVLGWLAQRAGAPAPAPAGDLQRPDLLHVLALGPWDGLFPRGALALTLERAAAELRMPLGRIRVDEAARPGQWPGAHALEARVSFRRQGGPADWLGLLEAVGQALAAAAVPPHRRAGPATFTMGALLSGLLLDPGFLRARLDVERRHAADLVRALALRQLFRLRARAAALRVATEVERGLSGRAWQEAHREALAAAALAAWPEGLHGRDGDAAVHAAALQGAGRAAALREQLVERCDVDWWRNPRAAEPVAAAMAGAFEGAAPPALAAAALVRAVQ